MTAALDPASLLTVAVEAARVGGDELFARFPGEREISYKGGIDLVTDADKASEAKILALLRERYPDHAILSEEKGAASGSAPYRWIIDPLDGTTNYAHHIPHFCVSIGVEGPGGLLAGAIYDPMRGELFTASKGGGAFLNGRRLKASPQAELANALLATGFPYDIWSRPDSPLALFDAFLKRAQGVRRMGSAALDLSYIAAGRFDGFFEMGLKAWDMAAGALMIEEAGGRATKLSGEPLDVDGGQILASNGKLHDAMIRIALELRAALTP